MTVYVFMITGWFVAYYNLLYRAKKLPDRRQTSRKKWFLFFSGIILFLVMGLRHPRVGIDTMQYLNRYHATEYMKWKRFSVWEDWIPQELGFTLVGKIFSNMGISDQGYLVIYALFITICISRLIYKYCRNLFWGFYLHTTIGLFTMSMSGMRQSIACCILWFGIDCILKKRPIRFVLLVLLASTFHQSAIFFVVFYFARYVKIRETSGWGIIGICILCVFIRPLLIRGLSHLMPEAYGVYGMVNSRHPVNPILIVIAILIPVFCMFFRNQTRLKDKNQERLYSVCFCGSVCYALISVLSLSSNMIGRMNQYFYIFNVILLGNVMSDIEDSTTRNVVYMFAILLPGYMFFKSQSLGISPYYFFWQLYGM